MARRTRADEDEDDRGDDDRPRRRRRKKRWEDGPNSSKTTQYTLMAAAAVTFLMCCGVGGCVVVQVRRTARQIEQAAQAMKPFEPGPPVARVSADDLVAAYQRNEDAADNKYLGESVQVDGVVEKVEKQPGGIYRVTLQVSRGGARVYAEFDPGKGAAARALQPGQKCSLIGLCDGKIDDFDGFNDPFPDPAAPGGGKWAVVLSSCRVAE